MQNCFVSKLSQMKFWFNSGWVNCNNDLTRTESIQACIWVKPKRTQFIIFQLTQTEANSNCTYSTQFESNEIYWSAWSHMDLASGGLSPHLPIAYLVVGAAREHIDQTESIACMVAAACLPTFQIDRIYINIYLYIYIYMCVCMCVGNGGLSPYPPRACANKHRAWFGRAPGDGTLLGICGLSPFLLTIVLGSGGLSPLPDNNCSG